MFVAEEVMFFHMFICIISSRPRDSSCFTKYLLSLLLFCASCFAPFLYIAEMCAFFQSFGSLLFNIETLKRIIRGIGTMSVSSLIGWLYLVRPWCFGYVARNSVESFKVNLKTYPFCERFLS